MTAVAVPIKDEENQIIGSIAIGKRNFSSDVKEHAQMLSQSLEIASQAVGEVTHEIEKMVDDNQHLLSDMLFIGSHATRTCSGDSQRGIFISPRYQLMTGIIYPGKRQFKRAIPACHGQKPWARHGQRKLAATVK